MPFTSWRSLRQEVEAWLAKRDSSHIVELLQPSKAEIIVEIGAGYGYVANKVANQSQTLVAVEPNEAKTRYIRRTYSNVDCIQAVGETTPFRTSKFEKCYAKKALHHVANLEQTLNELYRILKPGGFLVIGELKPQLIDRIERRIREVHINFLMPDALKQKLENCGFSVKTFEEGTAGYYFVAQK